MASKLNDKASEDLKSNKWTDISVRIHQGLFEMWQNDMCTDFEIEVDRKIFRCHKIVLASVSDYFKAMFSSGMREMEQNKVTFDDVNVETFETLLNIIYCNKEAETPLQNRSEDEISELFNLCERLQIQFLKDICLKYFRENMSIGNCLTRWKTSRNLLSDELCDMAFDFILDNFEHLVSEQMPVLLSLDINDVLTILEDEGLVLKNEDTAWFFIKGWIDVDRKERSVHFLSLLKECCLTQITRALLVEEIPFDPLVRYDDVASSMVQEAVKFKKNPGLYGNLDLKFRSCYGKEQSLVLLVKEPKVGDLRIRSGSTTVRSWSPCERKWAELPALPETGENLVCCVHGNSLFVSDDACEFGGSVFEYDGHKHTWKSIPELPFPLQGHTMSAINGYILVLGGQTQFEANVTVLQYTIDKRTNADSWTMEGVIIVPVVNASSVAVRDKVYLFGGVIERMPVDCVQMFDTTTKTGTIFCHLPKPCRWSRVVARGQSVSMVTSDGDVVNISLETANCEVVATFPDFLYTNFGMDVHGNVLVVYGGKKYVACIPEEDARANESTVAPVISDRVVEVDLNTGNITSRDQLPEKWEILGCARLVHSRGYDDS